MPGKEHAFKRHCFKMSDKTGLYKLDKKKNGNTFKKATTKPYKDGHEGGGALKMFGMAGPNNPYGNK
tara:strand:+ start:1344 stop:1544 length:201 start_codon:yes stop_codon:yes gene_type:complete